MHLLRLPAFVRPLAIPVAILAAALAFALAAQRVPAQFAAIRDLGPYVLLLLATLLALWFNRGRAFVTAASLLAAYIGWRYALALGPIGQASKAVMIALLILVPANVLLALLLPERGVVHHGAWRWLVLVAFEVQIVSWLPAIVADNPGSAWAALHETFLLRPPNPPLAARLVFSAAFAAAAWRAWPKVSEGLPANLEIGVGAALVAFLGAGAFVGSQGGFAAFMMASGLVLLAAVMQESHRMAFRDELTGLPSRRALDERLRGLGPRYTIAMADVDHFKSFNDTHGHHVGDQVLKLVAARLAEVGGEGKAFRYGGEEFTVLFENQDLPEVFPHLEKVRAAIEAYKMAVRGEQRPKNEKKGSKQRGDSQPTKVLSVTISIGVAEADSEHRTPADVVRGADEALYRAKGGGRNRVSR